MANIYSKVQVNKPGHSFFNLNHDMKFDCDMGQVIPVCVKSMVPGDVFKYGNEVVVRTQPLVAPIMNEINVHTASFFVPYRIMFGSVVSKTVPTATGTTTVKEWEIDDHAFETFLTGGRTGYDTSVSLPTWNVSNYAKYSLWDYLGFPVGVKPSDRLPLAFPQRAYNMIWNEYFRDQNLMDEVSVSGNESILRCCWSKDYFTSALTQLQRGQSPALPISGMLPVVWNSSDLVNSHSGPILIRDYDGESDVNALGSSYDDTFSVVDYSGEATGTFSSARAASVNLSDAVTFTVNDLRVALRVQEWLETNMRVGTHLNEFLIGHFGVGPHDETLQRPIYLGGSKSPVIVSEVLQTSSTDATSPQGNLAGHGISADRNYLCSYRAKEYGVFMTVLWIKPKTSYSQGIDREWLYQSRYDFYFPEFAHLSEQAVEEIEIFAKASGNVVGGKPVIFGYQGRFNELRSAQSKVAGAFRDTLKFWHLGRDFVTAPNLNDTFVECNPRKDIFAVTSDPGFVVSVGNILHAYRPMPVFATPRT